MTENSLLVATIAQTDSFDIRNSESLYIRSMFGERLQNVFHKTVPSRNKCFYNILKSSWSF